MDSTTVNSSIPFQNPEPMSFVLSSTGPQLLVYFYTDMGTEADGFEIDYWYVCQSYSQPVSSTITTHKHQDGLCLSF